MRKKYVRYHSPEWGMMADMGWITHTVDDDGMACMIWDPKRYDEYGRVIGGSR